MDLNHDCIMLLNYISEYEEEYVKISDLSTQFKVTEKTIRNKINQIEDFLGDKGYSAFDRKYGIGIRLNRSQKLKEYIGKFKTTFTPYQYVFSQSERKRFIQSELLQSQEPINISYFMSIMDVSKNTIIKELNEMESFFTEFDLTLVRKPRVGIYVEGAEKSKRLALSKVNSEIISVADLLNFISTGKGNSKSNILQFETLFSDIDINFLDLLLREIEENSGIEFSDSAYGSMITHLVIMIKRIQMDKYILLIDAPIDENLYEQEITIAQKMISRIEGHFNIEIPPFEVNYLALHLIGSRLNKGSNVGTHEEKSLRYMIAKMVTEFEKIYDIRLNNTEDLIDGLLLHLRPAINRIRFNLNIENPLYEDILVQYRELFEKTKKICVLLEDYLGKPVNNHEVSYIMLHFGAALQNTIEEEKPYRVILVCGTGIGTANMIKSQLKEVYYIDVVETVSARLAKDYPTQSYEFIISTIDIPNLNSDEYIKINPLLMKSDFEKLDQKLLKRKSLKSRNPKMTIDTIMSIIDQYAVVHNRNQLQLEIMMLLAEKITESIDKEGRHLRDYLHEGNIKLSLPVRNWKHTVDEGCSILERNGSILPSYSESIKDKLSDLGPYMVISPGIALLHTDINQGVLKTDFSLITLRQGIRFGRDDYDPVRLVITFATDNGINHIQALRDLAIILADSEKVLKIMNAESKKELIKQLQ